MINVCYICMVTVNRACDTKIVVRLPTCSFSLIAALYNDTN